MKKILALTLALCMVFALVACGAEAPAETQAPAAAPEEGAATEAPAAAAGPSSIDVCIASEPDTIDPALNSSVDGATMVSHLFQGVSTWSQDADGKLIIAPAAV